MTASSMIYSVSFNCHHKRNRWPGVRAFAINHDLVKVLEILAGRTAWRALDLLRDPRDLLDSWFGYRLITGTPAADIVDKLASGPMGSYSCTLSCNHTPSKVFARIPCLPKSTADQILGYFQHRLSKGMAKAASLNCQSFFHSNAKYHHDDDGDEWQRVYNYMLKFVPISLEQLPSTRVLA